MDNDPPGRDWQEAAPGFTSFTHQQSWQGTVQTKKVGEVACHTSVLNALRKWSKNHYYVMHRDITYMMYDDMIQYDNMYTCTCALLYYCIYEICWIWHNLTICTYIPVEKITYIHIYIKLEIQHLHTFTICSMYMCVFIHISMYKLICKQSYPISLPGRFGRSDRREALGLGAWAFWWFSGLSKPSNPQWP